MLKVLSIWLGSPVPSLLGLYGSSTAGTQYPCEVVKSSNTHIEPGLFPINSGMLSANFSLVQSVPSPTILGKLLSHLLCLCFLSLSPYFPTSLLLHHETHFDLSISMYLCVPPLVGPVLGFCSFVVPSCLLISLQLSLLSAIIYTWQIYTLLKRADPV